ncbi:3-oxoacyl-[acyl-carrier protein] reductase [Flavobacterium tiangeerense]|uniref:3-oxoacyl-[acyl-carrier protein] reductase n=1 Tax=Flavobacterium tiangeerense TaxID=459471 RepID=A0ABY3FJH6_9FLAO|nr:SDR family oxidoreductase [Flavobacterium tiangeerense]TWH99142.1 3-oxoacyl-[acyl-carrier protein] reductase [Flavobacterium tiangeerense]
MNILITGISKGLGLETSELLLKNGCTVYGISRTKTEELNELMLKYPNELKWLQYDLGDIERIRQIIFKDWIGLNTPIHGLVNNAAIAYDDIITNLNLDLLEKMYRVNVFAPMMLTKFVIRQMLIHKESCSIVHLSSISVHTGYKGLSMYASTKGALEAFSKNTAREWGEIGVRSNCLVAGFMETEMSSALSDNQKNRIYQRTSLKKPVDLNSVAETILFLVSNKAKSITGQNIHVDNGTI